MVLYISVSIFEPYPLCGVDGASESDAARCSGGASVRGMVAWHSIGKITAVCCTCLCYDRWGQHPREGQGEWSIDDEDDGIGRCALQSNSM